VIPALPKRPDPADPALLKQLQASTPAAIGVGRAGFRYRTQTLLDFLSRFAIAKAAVESEVPEDWAEQQGWVAVQSAATDAEQFLARPDLGRKLGEGALEHIRQHCKQAPDVQLVIGDGLSANAVMLNAPAMTRALAEELGRRSISLGTPIFVRHCRSKLVDAIGATLGAKVALILVGERPGLGTGDGMSAYLVWQPAPERTDAEKQAISNIHGRGMRPEEAGVHAAKVIAAILAQRTSGVGLDLSGLS
jgi:ethanolamine ammonia-lyase small subunit